MIILLTGKPGIGKSTVIEKFIGLNTEPATWVVTSGIPRPEKGGRSGFAATNSSGVRRVISHKTAIQSDVVVGENHVDLAAVDAMFAHALEAAAKPDAQLTIVDEIGSIQLLSPAFTTALGTAFSSGADVVATIHYNDERLAVYRDASDALLLEVTLGNRDILPDALVAMTTYRQTINQLSQTQRQAAYALLRRYVKGANLLQIQKLTAQAVRYVHDGTVKQKNASEWLVVGDHGRYHVAVTNGALACDCDLLNGRGQYEGKAGECSHIQAVTIGSTHQTAYPVPVE